MFVRVQTMRKQTIQKLPKINQIKQYLYAFRWLLDWYKNEKKVLILCCNKRKINTLGLLSG